MPLQTILDHYACKALNQAVYEQLEDGSIVGRVPELKGVIAFGTSRHETEDELFSVIEDWARVGMQRGLTLPVMGGVDLNTDEARTLSHY